MAKNKQKTKPKLHVQSAFFVKKEKLKLSLPLFVSKKKWKVRRSPSLGTSTCRRYGPKNQKKKKKEKEKRKRRLYTPMKNQWFALSDGIMGLDITILLVCILQFNYTHILLFYEHYCFCELRLEAWCHWATAGKATGEYLGAIIGLSCARWCAHQGDDIAVNGFVW